MEANQANSARAEWKGHWRVVAAAATGISLGAIPAYGIGLFIQPLEEAYGWSRSGISGSLTIFAMVGMLFSPAIGLLIDRFGTRRIAIGGAFVFCLQIALLSQISPNIWTWWAAWVGIGFAGLCIKPTVWSKAVTSFFDKGRGVALAVMASGTGLSTIALPALTQPLMSRFGWEAAFIGMGLVYMLVIVPLLWFWFFDASDKPAAENDARSKAERLRAMPGWTLRQGFRSRQLYQLGLAALLMTGIVSGYTVHIVGMLTSHGIPREQSVAMLSIVGVLAVASRIGVGVIFDRIGSPLVGTVSIAMPMLPALVLLFVEPSLTMGMLAVTSLGISIGAEYDAVLYLSSRFIGLKAFGVLFGIVSSMMLAGVGLGPVLAGYIFDQTRSYELYYILTIPVALLAGAMIATLGRYPDHRASE